LSGGHLLSRVAALPGFRRRGPLYSYTYMTCTTFFTFSNDIPISSQFTYCQYTILDLFGGLKYFSTFDTVFNLTDLINQSFINKKGEFVIKTEILKFKLKN